MRKNKLFVWHRNVVYGSCYDTNFINRNMQTSVSPFDTLRNRGTNQIKFLSREKKKLHSKNIRTPLNLFDWCICLVIVLLNRCHYHSTTLRKKDFKFLNRRLKEHEGKDWSEHTQTRQSMVFAFTTITKEAI